jgi:phage-related protein
MIGNAPKPVVWLGSSRKDLRAFPRAVQRDMGIALLAVQYGVEPPSAKALKGFRGRSVLELIEDHAGDTYRAVYTVRLEGTVYVLHAFQKKAKRGIATQKGDIEPIRQRLRQAEAAHRQRQKGG